MNAPTGRIDAAGIRDVAEHLCRVARTCTHTHSRGSIKMPKEHALLWTLFGIPLVAVATFVLTLVFARRAWKRRHIASGRTDLWFSLLAAILLVVHLCVNGRLAWEVTRILIWMIAGLAY